jgi:hypothetical protein
MLHASYQTCPQIGRAEQPMAPDGLRTFAAHICDSGGRDGSTAGLLDLSDHCEALNAAAIALVPGVGRHFFERIKQPAHIPSLSEAILSLLPARDGLINQIKQIAHSLRARHCQSLTGLQDPHTERPTRSSSLAPHYGIDQREIAPLSFPYFSLCADPVLD